MGNKVLFLPLKNCSELIILDLPDLLEGVQYSYRSYSRYGKKTDYCRGLFFHLNRTIKWKSFVKMGLFNVNNIQTNNAVIRQNSFIKITFKFLLIILKQNVNWCMACSYFENTNWSLVQVYRRRPKSIRIQAVLIFREKEIKRTQKFETHQRSISLDFTSLEES